MEQKKKTKNLISNYLYLLKKGWQVILQQVNNSKMVLQLILQNLLLVQFTKLTWRQCFSLLKKTVKIRYIIKTATIANF